LGLNPKFLEIDKKKRVQQQNGENAFTKCAYFVGKIIWSKATGSCSNFLVIIKRNYLLLSLIYLSNEVQEAAKKVESGLLIQILSF